MAKTEAIFPQMPYTTGLWNPHAFPLLTSVCSVTPTVWHVTWSQLATHTYFFVEMSRQLLKTLKWHWNWTIRMSCSVLGHVLLMFLYSCLIQDHPMINRVEISVEYSMLAIMTVCMGLMEHERSMGSHAFVRVMSARNWYFGSEKKHCPMSWKYVRFMAICRS